MRFTILMIGMLQAVGVGPTYKLTVIGGSGSGVYACAATVTIIANKTKGAEVFSQWTTVPMGTAAIEHHHQRKATVKNHGCADLTVEAQFTAKPPKK